MRLSNWIAVVLIPSIAITVFAHDDVRLLTGKVTSADGDPIEGALIEWGYFAERTSRRESTKTDKAGNYRLETTTIGPEFRLGVSAPGYAPVWIDNFIPGRADKPDTRTFTLKPGGELTSFVVDEEGTPLEGITILAMSASSGFYSSFSMRSESYRFPGPAHTGTTDAEGKFKIVDLPCTESKLVRLSENREPIWEDQPREFKLYWKSNRGISPRKNAKCGESVRVVVKRQWLGTKESSPGIVKGRVVSAISSQPIARFKVGLRYREGLQTFVNFGGEFVIEELIAGRPYEVHVYADGYAPGLAGADSPRTPAAMCYVKGGAVGTAIDDERVFECRLFPSPSFCGRLVNADGAPIEGARIAFGIPGKHAGSDFYWEEFEKYADGYMGLDHVQRMTTAEDGRFSFSEGSTPGVMAIIAPGYGRVFLTVDKRPEPDEKGKTTLELIEADASISGVVRRKGKIEANADIYASQLIKNGFRINTKADEQGRYQISNLMAGEYSISVYERLGQSARSRISHRITLATGEHKVIDLGLDNGPFSLSGTAPPFCWIELRPVNEESSFSRRSTASDADGKYGFQGLSPGKYEIEAHSRGSALTGYMGRKIKSEVVVIDSDRTENFGWR